MPIETKFEIQGNDLIVSRNDWKAVTTYCAEYYDKIPVCYYNTIDKLVLPSGGKAVLSEKQMLAIKEYLCEHWAPEFVFGVFGPHREIDSRDGFVQSFADVASGYYAAHCPLTGEECP